MKSLKITGRILRFFFRRLPFESISSSLAYILENLHPAILTILSQALFEAAGSYMAQDGGAAKLWVCAAIMILYFAFYSIGRSFSSVCINAGVYEKAAHLLRNDLVRALSAFSLVQYENQEMLMRKKRAEECVWNDRIPGIFMLLIVLVTSVAGIVSLLITLGAYHPLLPVIALVSVTLFFLSGLFLEKENDRLERAVIPEKRKRDYLWSLFTNLENVMEMRVMGFDRYLAGRWKAERDKVNRGQWKLDLKKSRSRFLCDVGKTLGFLSGVVFCLWLLRAGEISAGMFGACLVAFVSVQNVVGNFLDSAGRLPGFAELASDYFALLDEGALSVKEELLPFRENIETIALENVSFRYPHGEKEAVKSASLTIHRGEVVSLVGVNGNGKTTLVKLLLGIYTPERGKVFFNGKDLETLEKEDVYRHSALLTQDFALYPLSLAENIALADIGRVGERNRIREILRKVNMEEKLDGAVVGKEFGGPEFSEGQKQRLALGRVLFADRELVILDEPTSALDPLQENRILEEFLRLSKGRTTIIISHRVGLCRYVDKIAVMREGEIVECGTHEELMAGQGEYQKLYKMQSQWYEEEKM